VNGPRVFKLKNQERFKERVFCEVMEKELQNEKRNGNTAGSFQLFNGFQCMAHLGILSQDFSILKGRPSTSFRCESFCFFHSKQLLFVVTCLLLDVIVFENLRFRSLT